MKRILVGTDFSPASDRAVQVAVAWARRTGAALQLVHVVPPRRWLTGLLGTDLRTVAGVHRRAGAALRRLADSLDPARQIELSTALISGAASAGMVQAARESGADLLIAGARGEHEVGRTELTLGGTALKLLSRTSLPLLLVRSAAAAAPRSVVAAIDFSPVSPAVFEWACASIATGGRVTTFHAYEAPFAARLDAYGIARDSINLYSEDEQQRRERELDALVGAAPANVSVQRIVERGSPIDGLFERIRELEPDLVVMGRHVRRRERRPAGWPGSVARHMALFAPTNVLIVPPPG